MIAGQARRIAQAVHHETSPVAIRTCPRSRYIGRKNAAMSRRWPRPQSPTKNASDSASPRNGFSSARRLASRQIRIGSAT